MDNKIFITLGSQKFQFNEKSNPPAMLGRIE